MSGHARRRRGGPAAGEPEGLEQRREAIRVAGAQPGVLIPDEDFVARLHQRLRHEIDGTPHEQEAGGGRGDGSSPVRASRRRVLQVAAGAVGAVALGAAGDRAVEGAGSPAGAEQALTPGSGTWTAVGPAATDSGSRAVAFTKAGVAGVVVADGGHLRAVSAVCTHQGCLLRLDARARQLNCPCHATSFALSGAVLHHEMPRAPAPLPQLAVRERNGRIEVLLPRT